MIVVAPVFFAAAIYLGLTRLITLGGRYIAPFSPKAIYIIFLSFDIVTIIIQVAGAALIGVRESNQEDPTTANNILIAGLALQTASFAVFLVLLLFSVARLLRHKSSAVQEGAEAVRHRQVPRDLAIHVDCAAEPSPMSAIVMYTPASLHDVSVHETLLAAALLWHVLDALLVSFQERASACKALSAHSCCRHVVAMFFILLAAAVLVQLRTAFRLAESAQGVYGHLSSREAFFGCLEFLPIVLAVALLVYLGWSTRRDLAKMGIGVRGQRGVHGQSSAVADEAAKPANV